MTIRSLTVFLEYNKTFGSAGAGRREKVRVYKHSAPLEPGRDGKAWSMPILSHADRVTMRLKPKEAGK